MYGCKVWTLTQMEESKPLIPKKCSGDRSEGASR